MNIRIKLYEKYLKENEKADNTITKYICDIKEYFEWIACTGELYELAITKETLLKYKEYLKRSAIKISSINSKISSLNSFLVYTGNASLKLNVLKYQKSLFGIKEKELTKGDYKKLYDACINDSRLKLIIETLVKTGIRVSELKYITYNSVKLGRVIVNNKGKVRTILIPSRLCLKLINFVCSDMNKQEAYTNDVYKPIFITRNGTPIDRKQIWFMLKRLAFKANIPSQKVFPHNLRHLFGREFYRLTHDLVKLSSILGHSSIETTKIYTRETEDECREELEKLDFMT